MHVKNRLFTGCLAGALVVTLLPAGAVAAELVPGRPGRYELSSIEIDARNGDCKATYQTPAEGNLWMRGEEGSIRVHTNPRWVHVTCRFTDISRIIEENAEVAHTNACSLVTETAEFTEGWGIATSAANIGERADGGNSMVMCRFRIDPVAAAAGPAHAGKPSQASGPDGTVEARRRGGPPGAEGANPARSSRGARAGDGSTMRPASAKTDGSSATRGPSAKLGKAAKASRSTMGEPRMPSGKRTRN
jgi:hypothetical protein